MLCTMQQMPTAQILESDGAAGKAVARGAATTCVLSLKGTKTKFKNKRRRRRQGRNESFGTETRRAFGERGNEGFMIPQKNRGRRWKNKELEEL